jgi:hypothetical protein
LVELRVPERSAKRPFAWRHGTRIVTLRGVAAAKITHRERAMRKVNREPADAYWADRAHLEHKIHVFQFCLVAMLVVFALSQALWFVMYARVAKPVIVHASVDELSTEPTNVELQFMAWEVLRPFLSVDSSNVLNDIQASKRFMTEACIAAWDRSLASYERDHKTPYVQAVFDLGVQTQFGDIHGKRLKDEVEGNVTRFVVRIHGERTVLSKTRGTGEPKPFDYVVVLERAPQTTTNPIGVLVSEVRPTPLETGDGRERDGAAVVPYAAIRDAEVPSRPEAR